MNRIATYGRVPIKGSNCKRSRGRHRGVALPFALAASDREDRRLGLLRKGDRDNGPICSTARR
jgi:hypothetical protein